MRAHDTGIFGARTEGFVSGKIATTSVPLFPELISQRPPNCRTLSRMPCMPTPAFNPDEELSGVAKPLPSSWTSTRTHYKRAPLLRSVDLFVSKSESRASLVGMIEHVPEMYSIPPPIGIRERGRATAPRLGSVLLKWCVNASTRGVQPFRALRAYR